MKSYYLKHLLVLAVLLVSASLQCVAQKYPTRFLGFFIDGPKSEMIKKLQSKGFKYNPNEDLLTGNYFGEPVYILLNTRDSKMNRVLVCDIIQRDSSEVKKRFNEVYKRFKDNPIYIYMSGKKGRISVNENIAIGINHYSKNYRVVYGQRKKTSADSMRVQKNALIPSKMPPIDFNEKLKDFRQRLRIIQTKGLLRSISTTDDRYMNQVWFGIIEKNGKYSVVHGFDNLYNFTQPTDDEEE